MAQLLITGGAGFIGSHTCLALLQAGHSLVVLDNFSNSSPTSLRRVNELAQTDFQRQIKIFEGDICDRSDLQKVFEQNKKPFAAVVHFAGLKAVGESFRYPLRYWDVNVNGSRNLLEAMQEFGCRTIVFSSSATVYGCPKQIPISEKEVLSPVNPYGNTKAAVEKMLNDISISDSDWRIACLRYFNPVGAHFSGRIGEDPNGIPNNLFPILTKVAIGQKEVLEIFGADWPTPDGTPVRDYIHVMDLAEGHCAALNVLLKEKPQVLTINLGTGKGYSVLEVVESFKEVSMKNLPFKIVERRLGDVASSVAQVTLAQERLGWVARRNLLEMCRDAWSWQKSNPLGYEPFNS